MSVVVQAALQFLTDLLVEPWRRKLQKKLGGKTLWAYLQADRAPASDDLPPLPPKWRRRQSPGDSG